MTRHTFIVYELIAATCFFLAAGVLTDCSALQSAKPGADLTALELACVDQAKTIEDSRTCRNHVREDWAKSNGVTITELDGGRDGH